MAWAARAMAAWPAAPPASAASSPAGTVEPLASSVCAAR